MIIIFFKITPMADGDIALQLFKIDVTHKHCYCEKHHGKSFAIGEPCLLDNPKAHVFNMLMFDGEHYELIINTSAAHTPIIYDKATDTMIERRSHIIAPADIKSDDLEMQELMFNLFEPVLTSYPDALAKSKDYQNFLREVASNFRSVPRPRSVKQEKNWPNEVRAWCFTNFGEKIEKLIKTEISRDLDNLEDQMTTFLVKFAFYKTYTKKIDKKL